MSCGADGLVKIFDTSTFKVCHGLKYSGAVLSVDLSPDGNTLATGMASGEMIVRCRRSMDDESSLGGGDDLGRYKHGASQRRFNRGFNAPIDPLHDTIISAPRKRKLRSHDVLLKKFQYSEALDAALATGDPMLVVGVIDELIYRGGLNIALQYRSEDGLLPLLKFLVRYTTLPRYSKLLLRVCTSVIDLYASMIGQFVRVDELFFQLQHRIGVEVKMQEKLAPIQGSLSTLIAANQAK